MNIASLALFAVALAILTSVLLLVSRDWRVSISALGAQYVAVFILIMISWPFEYAVIKLIAGWIAAAVLGAGLAEQVDAWEDELGPHLSGILFRIFLAGLILFFAFSIAPEVARWALRAANFQIRAGLILVGMGLLHLGLTAQPIRSILGLLTVLSGFEIFYATIETSLLVNAILAAITLSLAFTGAYLRVAPLMEREE